MKTTIEISDRLFVAAKKRAVELRKPLRFLVEEGLRAQLAGAGNRGARAKRLKWVTVPGGLPRGLALESRAAMHEWLLTAK